MGDAQITLVAQRENTVYRVDDKDQTHALRLHRLGYRTADELQSELEWMAALSAEGLSLPKPVPTIDDSFCRLVGSVHADVLSWIPGQPLSDFTPQSPDIDWPATYKQVGAGLAKLHQLSDEWSRPKNFQRPSWNEDGLIGEDPLWDRYWENPALTVEDRLWIDAVRKKARRDFDDAAQLLDFGLIHADIVHENVMVSSSSISLIDFDDGGFGFRLFDLATLFNRMRREGLGTDCRESFLTGYHSIRPLDLTHLPMFQALRSLTYVGWNISRMNEPNGTTRNQRFLNEARYWCKNYLDA